MLRLPALVALGSYPCVRMAALWCVTDALLSVVVRGLAEMGCVMEAAVCEVDRGCSCDNCSEYDASV